MTTVGNGPTIEAVADAAAAADAAARLLAERIAAVAGGTASVASADGAAVADGGGDGSAVADASGERVAIALSGGTTPVVAYERLGPLVADWSRVDVFLADERCVPFAHPDSNGRLVAEALPPELGYVLHRLPEIGSPGDRARAYAHELGPRPLDVVLLGLGEDGHTASLFPGHGALDADGVTVAVLDSPKPPPERVSLTLPALAAAGLLALLVTGSGKADALARTLAEPSPQAPVSLLPRGRLHVIADEAALSVARAAGLVPDTGA